MVDIAPLFAGLGHLLRPGGRRVFSVMRPGSSSAGIGQFVEQGYDESGRDWRRRFDVQVFDRMTPPTRRGIAIAEQPEPQLIFDRPLQLVVGLSFEAGFVLDGLEERAFPPGHQRERGLAWNGNLSEIPPMLVARMRVG